MGKVVLTLEEPRLDRLIVMLLELQEEVKNMSAEVDAIVAKVEKLGTVVESTERVMHEVADLIRANLNDVPKLQEISEDLDAMATKLGAAVATGTAAKNEAGGGGTTPPA
jgi:methyl-accepting chemotaxis protein